jgi:hypothetical protein
MRSRLIFAAVDWSENDSPTIPRTAVQRIRQSVARTNDAAES